MAGQPTHLEPDGPAEGPPRLVHVMTVPQTLELIGGLVDYLADHGFEVHAVASPGARLERFSRRHRVTVHPIRMPRRISPLSDLGALLSLGRLLRSLRPVLVHSHTPKGGLLGMLAARRATVPARLYQIRGLLTPTARGLRRHVLRLAEKTSCALADEVVCQSPSLLEAVLDQGLCSADRVRVLGPGGNGVDARGRFDPERQVGPEEARRRLGIPAQSQVIGFVGRLVRDKGVAELIAAWRELRRHRPELRLLVVGPFEGRNAMASDHRRLLEEDQRAHLTGLSDEMPLHYRAMDVLALPTYREGFPNAPLEAAAMGIPVVATRVVGCVDAVSDGLTGTLVPARDGAALAKALAAYLDTPELRRRHGDAGRRRALERFRPEPIWQATLELYREVLGPRAPRPAGPPEPARDSLS